MQLLVIGSGAREDALAWKLAKSDKVSKVYVAPGNGGCFFTKKVEKLDIDTQNFELLAKWVEDNQIYFTLVGPEAPLVAGIVDFFNEKGLKIIGADKYSAQLEGSKSFAKKFFDENKIPTAKYKEFTETRMALEYLKTKSLPIVVKADGLAAGKGVVVAETLAAAEMAVKDCLETGVFGEAGAKVVIEDFLAGEEASFIVMTDGENILPFATSQDHKRLLDDDLGSNTGGMGAYSPAPVVTKAVAEKVMEQIIEPTIKALREKGHLYKGFLYAGLMIDEAGNPSVIEFNCRLGDPETSALLFRLEDDLFDLCDAVLTGNLPSQAKWKKRLALTVVMAADGYPKEYQKGYEIENIPTEAENLKVFHAGTKFEEGKILGTGGRVLNVTADGETIEEARKNAYAGIEQIKSSSLIYRKDIGAKAIGREVEL